MATRIIEKGKKGRKKTYDEKYREGKRARHRAWLREEMRRKQEPFIPKTEQKELF